MPALLLRAPSWRSTMTASIAGLVACAPQPAPEFRIGLAATMEGSMAVASGIPSERGARMAVDEINAAGGLLIDGKRYTVRLIVRSFDGRPDEAATAARALVNLDSVHALVGPQISAHAIPASRVAEAAQVPMIAPMASNPEVTQGKSYVFRLAFLDAFQGETLARFACEQLGLRRAAMLYDIANAYGREIAHLFGSTFESCGGRIVARETFTSDRIRDFTPQLTRVARSGADALLLPNYADADSVQVRQARALGFEGRFLGSDSWDPVSLGRLEESVGTIIVGQWDWRLQRDETRRFVTNYQKQFQDEVPRATAALTYDAIRLLVDAARRMQTLDADSLVRGIERTTSFDGAGSTYRFEGRHDPARGAVIMVQGRGRDSLVNFDVRPR